MYVCMHVCMDGQHVGDVRDISGRRAQMAWLDRACPRAGSRGSILGSTRFQEDADR